MRTIFTPAIILNKTTFREKDLILTLITRELGVVSAIALSALASKHRFSYMLDLFVVFQAELREKRSSSMYLLASGHPIRFFPTIFDSYERLQTAMNFIMIIRDVFRDAPVNQDVFDCICTGIHRIAEAGITDLPRVFVHVVMMLLQAIGHGSDMYMCVKCKKGFEKGARITNDGYIVCETCSEGKGMLVNPSFLEALHSSDKNISPGEATSFLATLISGVLSRKYSIQWHI